MTQRWLHPAAWWLWALGLGAAATRTANPLLLGLIIGIVICFSGTGLWPPLNKACAFFSASAATVLSPDASAASTALMKVRMRPTRAPLTSVRRALRRMRFLACGVLAIWVFRSRLSCLAARSAAGAIV